MGIILKYYNPLCEGYISKTSISHGWRMALSEFLRSVSLLFKVASKPTREELSISIRVTLLGVAIMGAIAFIIRFLLISIQGV